MCCISDREWWYTLSVCTLNMYEQNNNTSLENGMNTPHHHRKIPYTLSSIQTYTRPQQKRTKKSNIECEKQVAYRSGLQKHTHTQYSCTWRKGATISNSLTLFYVPFFILHSTIKDHYFSRSHQTSCVVHSRQKVPA